MTRKIQIIEIIEYVYEPRIGETDYYPDNIQTIEDAIKYDENELEKGSCTPLDLADDFELIGRNFRIIDEP